MRSLLFVPGDDERKIAKALDGVTKELIADLLPKSEPRPTRALPFSRARSVAVES